MYPPATLTRPAPALIDLSVMNTTDDVVVEAIVAEEVVVESWNPPARMIAALAAFDRQVAQLEGAELDTRTDAGVEHNLIDLVAGLEGPTVADFRIAA